MFDVAFPSQLNIVSGATSRRAALIHAAALSASVFLFANTMSSIPVPALTGVLMYVAMKMIQFKDMLRLYKLSAPQAGIFLYQRAFVRGCVRAS